MESTTIDRLIINSPYEALTSRKAIFRQSKGARGQKSAGFRPIVLVGTYKMGFFGETEKFWALVYPSL